MGSPPDSVSAVKVAVVEVLDRDGHARLTVPVWHWPITIGRAIDSDVVLDDAHVAPRHVTLVERDGVLWLSVGDTVNGVRLRHRQIAAREDAELPAGEVFQAGGTWLRVRTASASLAPEELLAPEIAGSRWSIPVLLAASTVWSAGAQWLDTDPGGRLTDYLPVLLGVPLMLAVWSGLWAAASKLVRHRFDFGVHLRVAFAYSLMLSVAGLVLPLAAFSFGWTPLSRVSGVVTGGIALLLVMAHLTIVLPSRRRVLATMLVAMFIVGTSLVLIRNYQVHDRVFAELYVSALGPPALRFASAVEPARFIEEARALKAILDAHVDDEDAEDLFGMESP